MYKVTAKVQSPTKILLDETQKCITLQDALSAQQEWLTWWEKENRLYANWSIVDLRISHLFSVA